MIADLLKRFINEEDGAGLIEYLILICIAAIAAVILFPTLRKNLVEWFNQMVDNISNGISGNSTTNPTTGTGTKVTWN
jgi:Flp pilus assembly pilin Flp